MDAKMIHYLQALGYQVCNPKASRGPMERANWESCLAHSRSPKGMVATHSAKEAWLQTQWPDDEITISSADHGSGRIVWTAAIGPLHSCESTESELPRGWGQGDSPQAAIEALCRKVLVVDA